MNRRPAVFLYSLIFVLGSCGWSATVEESSDPYADEENYSHSVSFSGQDRMEEARKLAASRDFDGAIRIYESLYQSDPSEEIRARALLHWAEAEHSPFNPDRDPDAAQARLELLLEDYPDSEVAAEASAMSSDWSN
jgi:hypothetical protein